MKIRLPGPCLPGACILLLAASWRSPAQAGRALISPRDGGEIRVEVWNGQDWQEAGRPFFGHHTTVRSVQLSAASARVRLSAPGVYAAYLDSVLLGGLPPVSVEPGAGEGALPKLLRTDNDILDLPAGGAVCVFGETGADRTLTIAARVVGEPLEGVPFRFPAENVRRPATDPVAFYTYRLGTNHGGLKMRGDLREESIAEAPLFRVPSHPVSGHPDADTVAWVRDDGERLFVALDFASDNTMDGDLDWAEVDVRVGGGLRPFRVSVPEKRWGTAGFTSTRDAAWDHKVYEFAIPLSEIGAPRAGEPVQLAFSAYGTSSYAIAIDLFSEVAQSASGVPGAAPVCTQGTLATLPPWSIIGSQRDLIAAAPASSPGNVTASVGPPFFIFDSTAGVGSASLIWDGVDDCTAISATTLLGNFAAVGSSLWINATNSGTAPVTVRARFFGATGSLTAPDQLLAPGTFLSPIPFSSFTASGGASFNDVRAVIVEFDTTAFAPGASVTTYLVAITGPPYPVTLTRFAAE